MLPRFVISMTQVAKDGVGREDIYGGGNVDYMEDRILIYVWYMF